MNPDQLHEESINALGDRFEDVPTQAKCPECGAPATMKWLGLHLVEESGDETLAAKSNRYSPSKLEAAAPDLLDALQELLECDYTSGTHLYCAQVKAKAAIKKATV